MISGGPPCHRRVCPNLLDAIEQALRRDHDARAEQAKLTELRKRYDLLTPREREVMAGVVSGMFNKQTADKLGATEKTIKFQRGQYHAEDAGGVSGGSGPNGWDSEHRICPGVLTPAVITLFFCYLQEFEVTGSVLRTIATFWEIGARPESLEAASTIEL